jgi:glycosyltransferase involved in cell wall biosynthesis
MVIDRKQDKPYFFVITFYVISQTQMTYTKWVHDIVSQIFIPLEQKYCVQYLKLKKYSETEPDYEKNDVYFNSVNHFFYLPLSFFYYVRKKKPSVVFIHGFLYPFQLLFLKLVLPQSTKVIVQHHAEKPFKNKIKRWFQRLAYSKADAYLFASKDLAKSYLDYEIIKDSDRIHEVMECSSLFAYKNSKREADSFLWVGRLDANKDPITVLKGFKLYLAGKPKAKLKMVYGTSDLEKEVKRFIDDNKMYSSVSLLGKIPHKELEQYYHSSQFFVAASHYEGSGVALCESMSCGCIPILSNIEAFRFMTKNGDCALLFEVGNELDLFHQLKLSETLDIEETRKKVLLQFKTNLSSEAIASKIEAISNQLLQNN